MKTVEDPDGLIDVKELCVELHGEVVRSEPLAQDFQRCRRDDFQNRSNKLEEHLEETIRQKKHTLPGPLSAASWYVVEGFPWCLSDT